MKRFFFALLCSVFFCNQTFSQQRGIETSLLAVVAAATVSGEKINNSINAESLYVSSVASASSIVSAVFSNDLQGSVGSQGIMTITGSLVFNNNDMLIALPAHISQLQISGDVEIKIPVGGMFQITVAGMPYNLEIPGLSVYYVNPVNQFDLYCSATVHGSLHETNALVETWGSLSVIGHSVIDRVLIDSDSSLTVSEDISIDGNGVGYVVQAGSMIATGSIYIHDTVDTGISGAAVYNQGNIQSLSGNITMIGNVAAGSSRYGIWNAGTISVISGSLTMNDNIGGAGGHGVGNFATVSVYGDITMNNNSDDFGCGVFIYNNIFCHAGMITMSGNRSGDGFSGIYNQNFIIASLGDIVMNENSGGLDHAGVENQGTINSYGNIIMNNNINTGLGGASFGMLNHGYIQSSQGSVAMFSNIGIGGAGVGNFRRISAPISVTMNNNQDNSGDGIFNDTGSVIQSTLGLITMNGNRGGAGSGGLGFSGVSNLGSISGAGGVTMSDNVDSYANGVGISNNGTISTSNNIIMNNNIGALVGVLHISGAIVTVNGLFTIAVVDDLTQQFDSSAVTITRMDGTTDVPFSSFAITVGGVAQLSYPVLHNRVVLANGNQ